MEGEDPTKRMAEIRSAHAQINSSGENLSDRMLAYAMTLALPESFITIKQTLWLKEPLTSSAVQAAVQAEWTRRSTEESAMANRVQVTHTPGNNNYNQRKNKAREWTEKWCSIRKVSTHNTRDCSLRQNHNSNTGQARLATNESSEMEDLGLTLHATAAVANTTSENTFIVDSGASHHMVNCKDLLHNYGPPTVTNVKIGNGTILPVAGQGTVKFGTITLQQVLHVPGLQCNLLAVNKIPPKLCWSFSSTEGKLLDQSTNKVHLSAPFKNGAYSLQAGPLALAYSAQIADSLAEWHHKLGHLGIENVVRLAKESRLGLNNELKNATVKDIKDFSCEACIQGKTGRLPSPPTPDTQASRPLEVLHIDIWGPASVTSKGGMHYFLTIYDDYSHRISLTLMRAKSEALQGFKNFVSHAENQTGHKVKYVRSDRGGEFTSSAFERFIKEKGIEHVLVPPGAHAQNGRVERAHLTILNGVRTLLVETGLPASLWGEAAKYIAFSHNCSFGTNKTIPFESWYGKRLQFICLHAFGEKVFFRDHTNTNKLQPCYHQGRFMGYASDSSTSSYRVLDMADMKIKVSRDIITLKKLDLPQPRMPARGNLPFGEENKHQRSYSEDPMAELPDSINTAPEPAEGARQQDNMEHAEEAPPVEQPQSPIELL